MSLALAIPVKDDHVALGQLLRQACRMGIFDQLIIVDDGSAPAIVPELPTEGASTKLTLLRHERALGPGVARNRALEQITTDYLVYMDSDDCFTSEFPEIWRNTLSEGPDLCLFRHHDTRQEALGRWGQMPCDEGLWDRGGLRGGGLARVSEGSRSALAETANYPWNKIYRTTVLRQKEVGCAETLVHEDIRLHWLSLLHARTVLASERIGVVHRVADGGERLTNRRGAERLAVFPVLQDVFDQLMSHRSRRDLVPAFLRFSSGLFDWIRGQLDPAFADCYCDSLSAFLKKNLTPALETELARRDPVLALRLVLQMAEGALPRQSAV